jgi:hypothetical protein
MSGLMRQRQMPIGSCATVGAIPKTVKVPTSQLSMQYLTLTINVTVF